MKKLHLILPVLVILGARAIRAELEATLSALQAAQLRACWAEWVRSAP